MAFLKVFMKPVLSLKQIITAILVPPFGTGDHAVFDELAPDGAAIPPLWEPRFKAGSPEKNKLRRSGLPFFQSARFRCGPAKLRPLCQAKPFRLWSSQRLRPRWGTYDLYLSGDAQITPAMHLHLARVLLGRLLGQLGERLACDGVRT